MPEISVILPVFNGQDTITEAIHSILDQTFTDFELVIINDGSTDNTLDSINTFTDSRIKVASFPSNRGIAKVLNFGLKIAQADIIARMDADDISMPTRLEKQYNYLQEHPTCGVISSLVIHKGENENQQGYKHHVDQINVLTTHELMYKRRFQDSPVAHPSVMYRKELVERFGGYSELDIPEDYELWLRFMHHQVIFNKVNDNLLTWRDLALRLSRQSKAYADAKFYNLKAKYLKLHFRKLSNHLPDLYVWGTGRLVNKNSSYLTKEGFTILGYIAVKINQEAERIIHFKNIPDPGKAIIVSYVRDRKGKLEIADYLDKKGYREGANYFLMS